jgi:hypothetical protein
MTQPITNNFTTANQDNNNFSPKGQPAKFLGLDVFATNPTSSIQEQDETSKTPQTLQTNLGDRLSTLANPPNTITIKPFDDFRNVYEMQKYFNSIIDKIYKSHNAEISPKLNRYMTNRQAIQRHYIAMHIYYDFWSNFTKFIVKYLTKNNHEISNIVKVMFYISKKQVYLQSNFMNYLLNATDKQIQELAENKNLYRLLLLNQDKLKYLDFGKIEDITKSITESNTEKEKIYIYMNDSEVVKSRKSLIANFIKELFDICHKRDIYIDSCLIIIIKSLLKLTLLTNNEAQQIVKKIIYFFNCFDTCNSIADTSILTKIFCYQYQHTNKKLLLSVCNITDEQIQYITSCKNKWNIIKLWDSKGFPKKDEISEIINNHKKNNTDDNSIKHVIIVEKKPTTALDPSQEAKNNILDCFYNQITSIYNENGIIPNLVTLKRYIYDNKESNTKVFYCKDTLDLFHKNLTQFIRLYLKRNNNERLDIIDTLFYLNHDRLCVPTKVMSYFINATDKQIQELAENKRFYRDLLVNKKLNKIDFKNRDYIVKQRTENNNKETEEIYKNIANSIADDLIKSLVYNHTNHILSICRKKDIDIDNKLLLIISTLVNTRQLIYSNTKEILEKIAFFFNSFDDYNTVIDTSILTNICCCKETTSDELIASICNITQEQIKFITSCKNKQSIIKPWISKGFPETEEINRIINNCKKNIAKDNINDLITASTSCIKPQSLTKTAGSYSATIVLDPSQADSNDISKELDHRMKVLIDNNTSLDDLFAAECLYSSSATIKSQDTDDNSTKVSTSYSNPQPDIIDLTNTDNNKEDLDGASKVIDDIVKGMQNNPHKQTTNDNENYDELWNLVKDLSDNSTFTAMNPDDAPNGLPEPNNTNESSLEHSPNKIPRLS